MLPDKDKADIMEWLLQLTTKEVADIASNEATPTFVVKCANMLRDDSLEKYFDLLHRCKLNLAEKQV